jgi:hypothetical protein
LGLLLGDEEFLKYDSVSLDELHHIVWEFVMLF